MLHLKLPTDPRWADVASKSLEFILTDHAYCEQKAAVTCISLIVQYSERQELVDTITPIVAEEWGHFELVLEEIRKRDFKLGKPRNDEYVVKLNKNIRKGGSAEDRLTDKLLVCALIEARSCERFKTLWKNLKDEYLSKFYYEFMVSEARHYTTFISLAREYAPREKVDKRWHELLKIEAEILKGLEWRGDRIH